MNTMRQVLMYQDEEDTWVVECPSLPGCTRQGQTKDEALRNIQEALAAALVPGPASDASRLLL